MYKDELKAYFSFTKKERNAVLILLILVTSLFILPDILPESSPPGSFSDTTLVKQIEDFNKYADTGYKWKKKYGGEYSSYKRQPQEDYRNRRPDKNYRRFNYPDKPYGSEYTYPYSYKRYQKADQQAENNNFPGQRYSRGHSDYEKRLVSPIIINGADTSDLLPLPGIGNKLAARIITFRDKLGGFYCVEQIAETYGLPDSIFQRIKHSFKIQPGEVTAMDLNMVSIGQLKLHPYFRWNVANAIVQYRNQHGNFSAVEDLRKIDVVTPDVYEKIAHYLFIKKNN